MYYTALGSAAFGCCFWCTRGLSAGLVLTRATRRVSTVRRASFVPHDTVVTRVEHEVKKSVFKCSLGRAAISAVSETQRLGEMTPVCGFHLSIPSRLRAVCVLTGDGGRGARLRRDAR